MCERIQAHSQAVTDVDTPIRRRTGGIVVCVLWSLFGATVVELWEQRATVVIRWSLERMGRKMVAQW